MVTAKIVRFEISYPVLSAFVNFSDDQGVLTQPQVIQISFSGEELGSINKDALYSKIKEYIETFEKMLSNIKSLAPEVNKEVDSTTVVAAEEIE